MIKLARLSLVDKLLRLFSEVHLTTAVRREIQLGKARRRNRSLARFSRRVHRCNRWDRRVFADALVELRRRDPRRSHAGESESIAQAALLRCRVFLTDDRDATALATRRGLAVYSTLRLARMLAEISPT